MFAWTEAKDYSSFDYTRDRIDHLEREVEQLKEDCAKAAIQRSLNAAFQDLLRMGSVGHGPRELERAHHEAEDGRRAATFRYGIGVRKQCGQSRHVASQPFFVVLPGGQGLTGDFREQRRRGAPACRVFKVSAVQVPPDRALEVQTSPLIFIEAMLLVGERACYRLTNELFLGLESAERMPLWSGRPHS